MPSAVAQTADQLTLVNLAGKDGDALFQMLQIEGESLEGKVLTSLDKAQALLDKGATAHLLVSYPSPVHVVAHAMAGGDTPSRAVDEWQHQAESVLSLYRKNRKKVTLIEASGSNTDLSGAANLLGHRAGMSVTALASQTKSDSDQDQMVPPLHLALATLALQYPPNSAVIQELEASALPKQDTRSAIALAEAAYVDAGGTGLQNKNELEEENELIIRQLHKTQEELEQVFLKKRRLEKKIKSLYASKSWQLTKPLRVLLRLLKGQPLRSKGGK